MNIPIVVAAIVAAIPAYGMYKVKTTKSSIENGWTYLPYAVERFGWVDGFRRWWRYHASPAAQYETFRYWRKRRSLIDRREKKSWSQTVHIIDRDGDFYIVECPQCNDVHGLWCHRPWEKITDEQWEAGVRETYCDQCQKDRKSHFHCSRCDIGIDLHWEDGYHRMKDHREGRPPLPIQAVKDDNGKWHLGIHADAPWWWTRREVCRDYRPETGKDAHGHEKYRTYPNPKNWMCGMQAQCEQARVPGATS